MKRIINKVSFLLLFLNITLLGGQCPTGPNLTMIPEKYLGVYDLESIHFWLVNDNKPNRFTGTLIIGSKSGCAQFIHNNASPVLSFSKIILFPETIEVFKNQCDKNTGEIKNPSFHLLLLQGYLCTPTIIKIVE